MNKFKKIFAIISICLIAVCSTTVAIKSVKAETEFGDWDLFYRTNQSIMQRHAHPRKLLNVPIYRQSAIGNSGVSCVASILRYAKYDFDIREDNLARALGVTEEEGAVPHKMVDYLNAVRYNDQDMPCFNAEIRQAMTIDDLKKELDKGNPVICDIQAWNWDENDEYSMNVDYSNEWECGHWVVAVGYNNDNIFFMDPSTAGNYTYIPNDKLLERWHDYIGDSIEQGEKTYQLGIIVDYMLNEEPDCERYKDAFYGLM